MTAQTFPIVGAFYRPPAKAILQVLPVGTPLHLVREPDNPHDKNAIAVFVETSAIPHTSHHALHEYALPYGFTAEEILTKSRWHLGYTPRDIAAQLAETASIEKPTPGTLSFSVKGSPQCTIPQCKMMT